MTTIVRYASIRPRHYLSLLSHQEVDGLMEYTKSMYQLFRRCALAVLNTDEKHDDAEALLKKYESFKIRLIPQSRGFRLDLYNAPAGAFVDGVMIRGIQAQLFAALRDIVYCNYELADVLARAEESPAYITDSVFKILRNASVIRPNEPPNVVVCWGGHSISREEYDFSKEVGYQLGLRGLDIATGCGLGAMKGPMKGAAVGHAKQQNKAGRYVGVTEPGIIAAESPNPIVNELVILPDIEKRLEAFVRMAHSIIVFPGGVGTAEEILYILSILMQKENAHQVLPLIFACPEQYKGYFDNLDRFLRRCLGEEVTRYYQIIVGDPVQVAEQAKRGVHKVHRQRRATQDAYGFNWQLHIPFSLQKPFIPTHENMASLQLALELPVDQLSVNLRALFSGIVAGNVKSFGIEQISTFGPYQLHADPELGELLNDLLKSFIAQGRMSVESSGYRPCFELIGY